ncbi:hypothetical protein [Aquitalea magnusonii]|uniref:Lipoprotein n=1 Tax=Aquitalea magnusonii TaxID=332411 RepID=A0A318JG54_9NEIS|nr:hypothetical protein [Aquitalea magnusonii]PXX49208.1 hypothetical protein DFR38_105251 [Aquitalea magnusonii]
MMKRWMSGMLLLSALAGCSTLGRPPRDAASAPVGRASGRVCHDAEAVLAGVRRGREPALPGKDGCAGERLRYVALQLLNADGRPDLARLQQQLDLATVQVRQEQSDGLVGLATLLSAQLSERRRHEEAVARANAQWLEQQRRADELAAKLDALRLIEQSMADKAQKKKIQP